MLIQTKKDLIERIVTASEENPHDKVTPGEARAREKIDSLSGCIYRTATAGGRIPILKSVMSTACEMNCNYCGMRRGRDGVGRVLFTPDEMARGFMKLAEAKRVQGLFLSSTIIGGGVKSQDRIIETAEILRGKYSYEGYIHLKIMPWAERDQIRRAAALANRLSLNLEATDQPKLTHLAPKKEFADSMLKRIRWAKDALDEHRRAPGQQRKLSLATQFVVGAGVETDVDLLALSANLIHTNDLQRVYFAGFSPIRNTPFENKRPSDPRREFRLYQASFLLRDYGWEFEEIPFEGEGFLPINIDPKRAYADLHLRQRPVDVMGAAPEELMRVPGIGPKSARKIIVERGRGRITDLRHLKRMGVRGVEGAAPYLLLDGGRPAYQMKLF